MSSSRALESVPGSAFSSFNMRQVDLSPIPVCVCVCAWVRSYPDHGASVAQDLHQLPRQVITILGWPTSWGGNDDTEAVCMKDRSLPGNIVHDGVPVTSHGCPEVTATKAKQEFFAALLGEKSAFLMLGRLDPGSSGGLNP